jgi:hypothetical protein
MADIGLRIGKGANGELVLQTFAATAPDEVMITVEPSGENIYGYIRVAVEEGATDRFVVGLGTQKPEAGDGVVIRFLMLPAGQAVPRTIELGICANTVRGQLGNTLDLVHPDDL